MRCEILVVDARNATLSAAHAAARSRVDFCVLEKAPRGERAGNSTLTDHSRFAYDDVDDLLRILKPWGATTDVRKKRQNRLPAATEPTCGTR